VTINGSSIEDNASEAMARPTVNDGSVPERPGGQDSARPRDRAHSSVPFETFNLAISIVLCTLSHRRLRGAWPSIATISNAFVIALREARMLLSSSVLCWMRSKENELCYAI
jgi:hypothetical protein